MLETVFDHAMCWLLMQMTDVRCSRCSHIKVGLRDIVQAGHRDRYQVLLPFNITSSILGTILCIFMDHNNHILIFYAFSWSVLPVEIPGTPQGMR